jgi:hypothetical protein
MADLDAEINRMTEVLGRVQASALVSEKLALVLEELRGNQVGRLLDAYARTLPTEPDDEWEKEAFRKEMAARADGFNRTAEKFLHELERIKRMRQTLNLEALDPIIHAARAIIHRIHDFTAHLQGH